jgi:hypothetical protein
MGVMRPCWSKFHGTPWVLFLHLHTIYLAVEPPRSSHLLTQPIPRVPTCLAPSKFRRKPDIRTCPLAIHSNTAALRVRPQGTHQASTARLRIAAPPPRPLDWARMARRGVLAGDLACR